MEILQTAMNTKTEVFWGEKPTKAQREREKHSKMRGTNKLTHNSSLNGVNGTV